MIIDIQQYCVLSAQLHANILSIAARSFQLAEHVQVKGAIMENGLLHVDLVREIPEAMKPRAIANPGRRKYLGSQVTECVDPLGPLTKRY